MGVQRRPQPPSTATVVRIQNGDAIVTDGPYVEGKEHVGGFLIIKAPDLDAALEWARKMARVLMLPGHTDSLPIEVRPFAHDVMERPSRTCQSSMRG